MGTGQLNEYLVRLGILLQADQRLSAAGLHPVQARALRYLTRCNRYSDRPAAVAEYLGITKGTASQTLQALEAKKLISKHQDPLDKRVVRLRLTTKGRRLVESQATSARIEGVARSLSSDQQAALEQSLG